MKKHSLEEEDYMSADFTRESQESILLYKRKRKSEAQGTTISPKIIEIEKRNKGLATRIDSDNKGFQMLQKMGFSGSAQEPVGIQLRAGRSGLGLSAVGEKSTRGLDGKSIEKMDFSAVKERFRSSHLKRFDSKIVEKDIRSSRLAVQDLDEKKGIERNEFWIPDISDESEFSSLEVVLSHFSPQ